MFVYNIIFIYFLHVLPPIFMWNIWNSTYNIVNINKLGVPEGVFHYCSTTFQWNSDLSCFSIKTYYKHNKYQNDSSRTLRNYRFDIDLSVNSSILIIA